MKRILNLLSFLVFTLTSYAVTVVGGINYNLNGETKEAKVTRYSSESPYSGSIVIPESITSNGIKYKVTGIENEAFKNSYITSVTIPNTITSIGYCVFASCSSLTSVTIPNSVTSIEESAFEDCRFTSITIPNSVTKIGNKAFKNCIQLTSIVIPNSVTSIGNYAFCGCYRLASVSIPNSVTYIGYYAFCDCYDLASVTIPNSVTSIEYNTFQNCIHITSVSIPESVTSIGQFAFNNCKNLTSVTIPNTLNYIANGAFGGCPIKYLSIDKEEYCSRAYFGTEIETLIIGNSVTSIGSKAFFQCLGLSSVTIPNSVKSVGGDAFSGCRSLPVVDNIRYADNIAVEATNKQLSSYTIREGTRLIPPSVFTECAWMYEVTIPSSVERIGSSAFGNCSGLRKIYCHATTPPEIDFRVFNNVIKSPSPQISAEWCCEVFVPIGAKSKYESAWEWREFKYIIEYAFESEGIVQPLNETRAIHINTSDGLVTVVGLNDGEKLEAYTSDGRHIVTAHAEGNVATFSAPQGTIIIKTGNETFKTIVK